MNDVNNENDKMFGGVFRLNAGIMGLALGLLFGLVIFIATNWLVIMGHITSNDNSEVGPHLKLLGEFFLGYRVSFLGSFVGFVYGFALGTLSGSLIAWIYNKFVDFRN
ncbi:MAG: hypothetical protein ACYSTS_16915 [Planctomycetota bacterium]|jgi:hypothetical protein